MNGHIWHLDGIMTSLNLSHRGSLKSALVVTSLRLTTLFQFILYGYNSRLWYISWGNFDTSNVNFLIKRHFKQCMILSSAMSCVYNMLGEKCLWNPRKIKGLVILENEIAKTPDLWHPQNLYVPQILACSYMQCGLVQSLNMINCWIFKSLQNNITLQGPRNVYLSLYLSFYWQEK